MSYDYEHQDLERKIQDLERKLGDLEYELRRAVDDLHGMIREKANRYHSHDI